MAGVQPIGSSSTMSPAYGSRMPKPAVEHPELKKAVDDVVGELFFGPILKSIRDNPLKGKYGHGGRGEEIFMAQLHEVFASKLAQSTDLGVNEALYQRFARYM